MQLKHKSVPRDFTNVHPIHNMHFNAEEKKYRIEKMHDVDNLCERLIFQLF